MSKSVWLLRKLSPGCSRPQGVGLARLGYKGIATAQGFRTPFSTCINEAGRNSDVLEKPLAHEECNGVRGAYNRAQRLGERVKLTRIRESPLETSAQETASGRPILDFNLSFGTPTWADAVLC